MFHHEDLFTNFILIITSTRFKENPDIYYRLYFTMPKMGNQPAMLFLFFWMFIVIGSVDRIIPLALRCNFTLFAEQYGATRGKERVLDPLKRSFLYVPVPIHFLVIFTAWSCNRFSLCQSLIISSYTMSIYLCKGRRIHSSCISWQFVSCLVGKCFDMTKRAVPWYGPRMMRLTMVMASLQLCMPAS